MILIYNQSNGYGSEIMKINDLKFRDMDTQFFFVENLKDVKRVYKKLHIKEEIHPIIVFGFIDHEKGIQFRILGNVIIENGSTKIEEKFIKKEFILPYDFFEEIEIKQVPEINAISIDGAQTVKNSIAELYSNKKLLQSRENTALDKYRDLRLVDDVQFLLLNKEEQQENVWARIEAEEDKGMLRCTLLDKTKKSFNLKPKDQIYIKYIEHPKYKGLMFVKKINP